MAIQKRLLKRRIGDVYSYQGFIRESSDDPNKENAWKEVTGVIIPDTLRRAAPESEVREHCIKQIDLYLLRDKAYPATEEEEFIL